ncbi:hypothetical protein [Aquisalimonas sp.]|uniref:hypothetical protein n=1 Tax=Aquisalimonas sp. TaxID=1872621 RepID=UPI0025C0E048|nr:hypothetical protein [Aquisalimonas sp.]
MSLLVRLAAGLFVAGLAQSAHSGLDAALEEIDAACRERAAEVVAEEWPQIEEQAEERGLEVTPRHRAMHERVLRRRCQLADRIEFVEGLRDDLSDEEWQEFGGDELLRDLREEFGVLRN